MSFYNMLNSENFILNNTDLKTVYENGYVWLKNDTELSSRLRDEWILNEIHSYCGRKIPVKFDETFNKDRFQIINCRLDSLEGFPSDCDDFRIERSSVNSLKGIPKKIKNKLYINDCTIADYTPISEIEEVEYMDIINTTFKTNISKILPAVKKMKHLQIYSGKHIGKEIDIPFDVENIFLGWNKGIKKISMKSSPIIFRCEKSDISSFDDLDIDFSQTEEIVLSYSKIENIDRLLRDFEKGKMKKLKTLVLRFCPISISYKLALQTVCGIGIELIIDEMRWK